MTILKRTGIALLAIVVAACGGGGGSDTPAVTAPDSGGGETGGIIRTGIVAGSITNFGSVIVNGVRFDTSNAGFTLNGEVGSESDLAVGQFVVVSGEIDDDLASGTATDVIYEDNVTGPVQSRDVAANSLVVLGQTVLIDADTSFDDSISPGNIDGIAIGDIVEVSGLVDANGAIRATRIEDRPAGSTFEVLGVVSGLDSAAQRFSINALVVDFGSASIEDFPGGSISNGDLVEARGASLGSGGELLAQRVQFKASGIDGPDGARVEVEGLITRFASATDFDVGGIQVTTTGSTVFEGGTSADLGLNVKVEVEGDLDANGVIVATKVDIRRASAVRITALVDSVDTSAETLTVLDIVVDVDALTRFEDKTDADKEPLVLADLNAGDYVEIRGTQTAASGSVLAALVEREDPDSETELQGFVEAFNDPEITILGVRIDTTGAVFRDENDAVLSRSEFFSRLAVNALVKASGTESSAAAIDASEVEFELED